MSKLSDKNFLITYLNKLNKTSLNAIDCSEFIVFINLIDKFVQYQVFTEESETRYICTAYKEFNLFSYNEIFYCFILDFSFNSFLHYLEYLKKNNNKFCYISFFIDTNDNKKNRKICSFKLNTKELTYLFTIIKTSVLLFKKLLKFENRHFFSRVNKLVIIFSKEIIDDKKTSNNT